ncbi:Parvulin-like peptidyl-prolyl isomerase [Virgibacillus subterraneus]|uniref:peptidylprolyl isomerase n=2 Tax=Virgibacillus TaxID=84406 RepID=A0A1H0XMR6_9BACI|nr:MULTISPECIES: peptidylprolyl isomerase [Virgibacillus]SDQ04163.1 Parvulin-like peptidyl-prolyl isomerase [Virgibacillus salinus]SEQ98213.1 Parvulin-like peptidyl-prolyl isomerase [Virgibacillus subterraneus]
MKKKFLLAVIVVLLITNVATLLIWNNDENVILDNNDTKIDQKKPVATVNGEEIPYEQWMKSLRGNYGEEQLKGMINQAVVKQLADEKNIKINDKVIAREIALLTSMQSPMSAEEMKQKEDEWREDILYRYQLGALLTADSSIPEEEIKAHFDEYGDQYNFQASLQISHIIVPNFETAEKVKKELDNGASFDLLAQEYSTDEETKASGGYLGLFVNESKFLPGGYLEAASSMDEQTYSDPFQSDTGVAIIYLHQKLPSITFEYDEIKPYIKRELALGESNQTLTADPLWDKLDIDWVYEE